MENRIRTSSLAKESTESSHPIWMKACELTTKHISSLVIHQIWETYRKGSHRKISPFSFFPMPGEFTTLQVNFHYPLIWTLTKHHSENVFYFLLAVTSCCIIEELPQPSTSQNHHLTPTVHTSSFLHLEGESKMSKTPINAPLEPETLHWRGRRLCWSSAFLYHIRVTAS